MDGLLWAFCLARLVGEDAQRWLASRSRAQGTIEYALIAAGIAVVALGVVVLLGNAVKDAAAAAADAVTSAGKGAVSGKP